MCSELLNSLELAAKVGAMRKANSLLVEHGASAYLRLVPSLAHKIEGAIAPGSTAAERELITQQMAIAALSKAAKRAGLRPSAYARALLTWLKREEVISYWRAATIVCCRDRDSGDVHRAPLSGLEIALGLQLTLTASKKR